MHAHQDRALEQHVPRIVGFQLPAHDAESSRATMALAAAALGSRAEPDAVLVLQGSRPVTSADLVHVHRNREDCHRHRHRLRHLRANQCPVLSSSHWPGTVVARALSWRPPIRQSSRPPRRRPGGVSRHLSPGRRRLHCLGYHSGWVSTVGGPLGHPNLTPPAAAPSDGVWAEGPSIRAASTDWESVHMTSGSVSCAGWSWIWVSAACSATISALKLEQRCRQALVPRVKLRR